MILCEGVLALLLHHAWLASRLVVMVVASVVVAAVVVVVVLDCLRSLLTGDTVSKPVSTRLVQGRRIACQGGGVLSVSPH